MEVDGLEGTTTDGGSRSGTVWALPRSWNEMVEDPGGLERVCIVGLGQWTICGVLWSWRRS